MQEEDAARRLAILRGEEPPPLEPEQTPDQTSRPARDGPSSFGGTRRKRKRHGEDDTDFEMRVARERAAEGDEAALRLRGALGGSGSVVDAEGRISLFEPPAGRGKEKAIEWEKQINKKKEEEDQIAMRFSNAAGKGGEGLTDGGPWYIKAADGEHGEVDVLGKDVWGNEDPKRKQRDAARLGADDPLAMMKKGAAKVRDLGKERRREAEERERELQQLRREERRREKRRKRKREDSQEADDLEGFNLDAPTSGSAAGRQHDSHRRERSRHRDGRHRSGKDSHGDKEKRSRSRREGDDTQGDGHRRRHHHRHSGYHS